MECLFDLSDNEDSNNRWDGDCCLKDLANTEEQEQILRTDMASVDKEKNHMKKKEIINHKKDGPIKTKEAKWKQTFSKRKVKYVSDTKGGKKEGREQIYPKMK